MPGPCQTQNRPRQSIHALPPSHISSSVNREKKEKLKLVGIVSKRRLSLVGSRNPDEFGGKEDVQPSGRARKNMGRGERPLTLLAQLFTLFPVSCCVGSCRLAKRERTSVPGL